MKTIAVTRTTVVTVFAEVSNDVYDEIMERGQHELPWIIEDAMFEKRPAESRVTLSDAPDAKADVLIDGIAGEVCVDLRKID